MKQLMYIYHYKQLMLKTSAAMLHYKKKKKKNMASLPISSCTSRSNQVQKRILAPLSGLVSLRTMVIVYGHNCISLCEQVPVIVPNCAVKCVKDFFQLLSKKAPVLSNISSGSILHFMLLFLSNTDLTVYVL